MAVRERSSGRGGCSAVSPVRGAGGAGGALPLLLHRGPTAEGPEARGRARRRPRALPPARRARRHVAYILVSALS